MATLRPDASALSLENFILDGTVDSATTEASGYPKSKLLDALRSRRWRSTAITQTQVAGEFEEAKQPTVAAFIDSNLVTPASDLATILAQAAIWLKADSLGLADAASVSSWSSEGTDTAAFTGSGASRPTHETNEIDAKAVVRFGGTHLLTRAGSYNLTRFNQVHLVVKPSSVASLGTILSAGDGSGISILTGGDILYTSPGAGFGVTFATGLSAGTSYLLSFIRNGSSVKCYKSGVLVSTETLSDNQAWQLSDLGASSAGFQGDVAEVVAIPGETYLGDAYRIAVQDCLAAAWNVSTVYGSLVLELANNSAFTSSPLRWTLQSYTQGQPGTLAWYLSTPDNRATVGARSHWRVTIPASATTDAYYEIGVIWLGTYTDLEVADASTDTVDPSPRSYSAGRAPYVDTLSRHESIDIDVEALTFADAYALKESIRSLGPSHALLDLHAAFSDEAVRAAGAWYGMLSERRGASLSLKSPTENSISLSFEESGG